MSDNINKLYKDVPCRPFRLEFRLKFKLCTKDVVNY